MFFGPAKGGKEIRGPQPGGKKVIEEPSLPYPGDDNLLHPGRYLEPVGLARRGPGGAVEVRESVLERA